MGAVTESSPDRWGQATHELGDFFTQRLRTVVHEGHCVVLNEDAACTGHTCLSVVVGGSSQAKYIAVAGQLKFLDTVDPELVRSMSAIRTTRFSAQAAVKQRAVRAIVPMSSAEFR